MNICNAINIFSYLQDQQEESTESNSLSLSLGIGAIAIGIFSSAWYLYPKYLKCSEYRKFCRNLDSWCVKAASIQEKESRQIAANRIKECYWNKSLKQELSSLGLTSLPPEIRELEHLRELDLSGNEFQALPA